MTLPSIGFLLALTCITAALVAFYFGSPASSSYLWASNCSHNARQTSHLGYLEYECSSKPFQSSWQSWWHPDRMDWKLSEHNAGAGAVTKDWNILYHLGGNGPWVEKVINVVDGGVAIPTGCDVEQVHMVFVHRMSV